MNWRILSNAARNTMTILGVAGTLGYFVGSKVLADVLGAGFLGGVVYALYWLEIHFRELRLSKGWYQ